MGAEPDVIKRDIERTRSEMSETVEAIGYKADVPSRAKESISGTVDSLKSKVTGATPDPGQAKHQARRAAGAAQDNPLGLAIGAVAAGFLAGMLTPSTRRENEAFGEVADQVKGQIAETAQTAVEHGKQAAQDVAQQTAQAAKDATQQAATEHGQEVKETAQSNAQSTAETIRA